MWFFEWVDPKLCEHGRRVANRLRQRHENLVAEAKRCETLVQVEVEKAKAEMAKELAKVKAEFDNEIVRYRKEIEMEGSNSTLRRRITRQCLFVHGSFAHFACFWYSTLTKVRVIA
ncbi:hypothetical protein SLA2020_399430 [Shorea laevis]